MIDSIIRKKLEFWSSWRPNPHIMELALRRFLKVCKVKLSSTNSILPVNVRIFNLLSFDLNAMNSVNLKWEKFTESPLAERISDNLITEAIVNPNTILVAILPTLKK